MQKHPSPCVSSFPAWGCDACHAGSVSVSVEVERAAGLGARGTCFLASWCYFILSRPIMMTAGGEQPPTGRREERRVLQESWSTGTVGAHVAIVRRRRAYLDARRPTARRCVSPSRPSHTPRSLPCCSHPRPRPPRVLSVYTQIRAFTGLAERCCNSSVDKVTLSPASSSPSTAVAAIVTSPIRLGSLGGLRLHRISDNAFILTSL